MARYIDAFKLKRKIADSTFIPDWCMTLVNRVIDDEPKVGISENATTTSTIDYQQKYESADKTYQDLLKSFKEQEERIKELNEYIQRLEDVISKTTNDNCRLTKQVKTAKAILKILWEDAEDD